MRLITSNATTPTFADTKGRWYADDIQALYESGIITGYEDGSFKGQEGLTRQQTAAMLGHMLAMLDVKLDSANLEHVAFADMKSIAGYAIPAVKFLVAHDVLNAGETTNFNPKGQLTRAQMAKMLLRTLQLTESY